jgi:hypothetical protein
VPLVHIYGVVLSRRGCFSSNIKFWAVWLKPFHNNANSLFAYFEKRESYCFGCVYFISHLSSLHLGVYFEWPNTMIISSHFENIFSTSRVRTFKQTLFSLQLFNYVTLCLFFLSRCYSLEHRPITLFTKSLLSIIFGATSTQYTPWYFNSVVSILILWKHFRLNYARGI